MGTEINLLDLYPRSDRNVDGRAGTTTEADRKLAKEFGREFFDGPRNQGYGGYTYDGRWNAIAGRFKEYYGLTSQSSVLDVGCAKGFFLHDLLETIPDITVAGIDISSYAIENSMESVKPFLLVGNAKELPYSDNSFDLVVAINTIHNLNSDECRAAVQEIERISRGNSFITVDAYRNDVDKERMFKWNLTAETMFHVDEWKTFFAEAGYTGDYFWFIP
jgi:SAM-dependent methyltransferase